MIALSAPRPRLTADDYASLLHAAVERAQRFQDRTAALTRAHDERQRRLRAMRGPRLWATPSPGAPRPC